MNVNRRKELHNEVIQISHQILLKWFENQTWLAYKWNKKTWASNYNKNHMYQLTEFCIDETANPKFLEMLLPLNNDILKKNRIPLVKMEATYYLAYN